MDRKRIKRLISILTAMTIILMSFAGAFSVNAEDAVLESISAETVCAAILSTDSTINVTATQEDGFVGVAITSELLKNHENGEGTPGYWAGFAVVAPEGATHLKYAFGTSDEITLGEAYELTSDDVVTADGKKGIAFYANAGSNDSKTYAKLQWFLDETTAMSAETTFVMNLGGIVRDGIDNLEAIALDTISAAILSAEADSEINVTATKNEDYIEVAITSDLLKEHENGEGTPGYWAGFAVAAPEGATHLKYAFGTSDEITLGEAYELTSDDVVTADGKKGIAFYANASDHDAKTYAKLQWLSDAETALSEETTFVMNLDGIVLDGIEKDELYIDHLDKKSETVVLWHPDYDDDVSVDFSKIKMEYYEGTDADYVTEFDVANVADYDSDAAVYGEGSYKVELLEDNYYYDYDKIINIAMKDLVKHTNGNGDEGFWTGFSVKGPEGAKQLEYWKSFGNNRYYHQTITLEEGHTEESFYLNVTECSTIESIELLWLDAEGNPLSVYEDYYINLSDVELATEGEIEFAEANVCDSFPGENAPAKVYETYTVAENNGTIKIQMEGLVLHRNAEKDPGYWTGFTVNGPEGATSLRYWKDFGNSGSGQVELTEGETEVSFYIDAEKVYNWEEISLQWFDENGDALTRKMSYEINLSDVECIYPEENTIEEAVVADFETGEIPYDEGTYSVEYDYGYIKLNATNLKAHTNGNEDEGHWIGFKVNAPEDATHYTYWFGDSYEDTPVALEDGETSVSFYVNASSPDAKDYLEIRWYCDEDEPESYPYAHAYDYCSYYIDITDVDLYDDKPVAVDIANIVNQMAPEVAPYTGTPSVEVEEDGTIKLAVEGLKTHFNGIDAIGAWVGVSFAKPEGAAKVKYEFYSVDGEWNDDYIAVEDDEISFYTDAAAVYPKDSIRIQWFDENDVAITNIYNYTLDLSGVKIANGNAALSIEKANIVDQADPDVDPFLGEYDAKLVGDTIVLSADFLMDHENGVGDYGLWIGFKASVEGAKYLKYVFDNERDIYDDSWDRDSSVVEISDSETFYVDADYYRYKDTVMLQWFDENGIALTDVNTYKIDIANVTTEDWFPVLLSNIELTGSDARFYELEDDKFEDWLSTKDYVYVLTFAGANGSVALTVNGTDESNGGNVFYRDENKTVTLTATPNSGYAFNGWYDMNSKKVSNTASYELALDNCYELEARFKKASPGGSSSGGGSANYYTVSFNSKGGSAVDYVKVEKEGTISAPAAPFKEGFLFDGWYIDSELTQKYDFSAPVTKSFTLYAKWVESEKIGLKFTDINNTAWYYDTVKKVVEKGLMNGISETTFAPELEVTRGMFVTILYRAAGEPEVTAETNFADVTADKYYAKAVAWANATGIVAGITETEFAPDNNITREQMAAILYRYAKNKAAASEIAYADKDAISDYALEAVAWAKAAGIMEGNADGTFAPTRNASRAEAAAVFVRMFKF